jgi:Cytochrome c/Cytochrome C oxidase, cbb3-type, subunit III
MRQLGKWILIIAVSLAAVLAIAITLTIGWRPFIGPRARPLESRTIERTPQRIERGRYIATALSGCLYCHSRHDWSAAGTPIIPGSEGSGDIQPEADLPGRIVAPNLTPDLETGAGTWSDDQLARAIREGIGHDGRALFPMMPYEHYRTMSDEDLASVIAYFRTLPAVRHELPKTEIIFPVKYLIRSVPQPVTSPVADPTNTGDLAKRGAQLVNLAGCADCHTPMVQGKNVPGMEFAGGQVFAGPWGSVASANLTPDPSGIPYYDESLFIQVIRTGYVKARPLNAIMPVLVYKNLTDDDLKAMFAYLRTLKPIRHHVDNSEPAAECKLCRQKHGGGGEN